MRPPKGELYHDLRDCHVGNRRRTANDLIELFRPLMPKVRAEPGCIEYTAMIDTRSGFAEQEPPRDNTLVVVEKWESLDALISPSEDAAHGRVFSSRRRIAGDQVQLQVRAA